MMVVFTVIGISVTFIALVYFAVIGYGEIKYNVRWEQLACKILGHKVFNREGQMHDYCLRCKK